MMENNIRCSYHIIPDKRSPDVFDPCIHNDFPFIAHVILINMHPADSPPEFTISLKCMCALITGSGGRDHMVCAARETGWMTRWRMTPQRIGRKCMIAKGDRKCQINYLMKDSGM